MDAIFHMMLGRGLLFHLERDDIATTLVDREALHWLIVNRAQETRIDIEAATTTITATITSTTTTITMTTTTITTVTKHLAALIAIHLNP